MNQEVETTHVNQFVWNTNVPHLVAGIKQELDNETKHNIQSQFPFHAEKIKREHIFIKSEEITSCEDLHMRVRKVDRFYETGLEKMEQSDLFEEDTGRHIKDEMCTSTCSCCTDSHTDVKMESSCTNLHSQLIGHDTVSGKLPEDIRNTEKTTGDVGEGLERLLVYMRKIVKNTDVVDDLGGLPEHTDFETITGDKAGSFEVMQVHTESLIMKTENKTGDLHLTSTEQGLNESNKVGQCQEILKDINAEINQNDNTLSLNNEECGKLSTNFFFFFKEGTKHALNSTGSDKIYKCDTCGDDFITHGSFNTHTMQHKVENPFKCNIYCKEFTHTNHPNVHKRIYTGEKPYKCDVCSKGFTNTRHYNAHKRIHTGERPYKCNFCGKGFNNTSHHNAHKRIHTGQKPYKCDVCGKEFTQTSYLNTHKRIHTGEKPYKCKVCGKGFTQNSCLNTHQRIHTGEKPYKCDVCGKGFTQISHCSAHTKIHTGEKPYKCNVCHKGYSLACSLNSHKIIHAEENPYKCDICCKQFTEIGQFNIHTKIHTKEKPYKCDVCSKEFTYPSHLNAHKRIHTGEKLYKCNVCGKGFTQTSHLSAHERIHTGEKPYKCDICGKGFIQTCGLNAHKVIHTGEKL